MVNAKAFPKRKTKAEVEKSVMAILLDEEINDLKSSPGAKAANEAEKLDIDSLVPFPNHPFSLYEGERFNDMVRSIKDFGVLLPVIVRPLDGAEGTFEILSGHNRINAAKQAGLTEVPAIIKLGLTDDEAELIVTETNLIQRSFAELSHSQRAIALKRHMDAISRQGKRTDLIDEIKKLSNPCEYRESGTSCQVGTKSDRVEKSR